MNRKIFLYCLITYQIYFWVICIGCATQLVLNCVDGHQWISHIIFLGFLGLVFLAELLFLYLQIPAIKEKYKDRRELSLLETTTSTFAAINKIKSSKIYKFFSKKDHKREIGWWIYCEICSILALLDTYTDCCFVVLASSAKSRVMTPALLFLILCSFLKIFAVLKSFWLLFQKNISGETIYQLFVYNEMMGSAYLVRDEVTSVVRLRGKIITGLTKFFLEDIIQMVCQIMFLKNGHCEEGKVQNSSAFYYTSIAISILLSLLTLVKGKIILEISYLFRNMGILDINDSKIRRKSVRAL
jgi:hypothetical protein